MTSPSAIGSPAEPRAASGLRPLDPFPHLARIETRLHPGEQENQHPEHEQRDSRNYRRVVRDLDQGDQHPEHHHLDHAPGPGGRVMAQQRPDPSRRTFAQGSQHDRQHEADLQRRRDDRGQQHQHRDHRCPFCHRCSAPPITVVEAARPTIVSPSIGTEFATTIGSAAAIVSASVRFSESSRRRHSSLLQRGHRADAPGASSGSRCSRSQCMHATSEGSAIGWLYTRIDKRTAPHWAISDLGPSPGFRGKALDAMVILGTGRS